MNRDSMCSFAVQPYPGCCALTLVFALGICYNRHSLTHPAEQVGMRSDSACGVIQSRIFIFYAIESEGEAGSVDKNRDMSAREVHNDNA